MTDRSLRAALSLYPEWYRHERGEEITAVYDLVRGDGGRLLRLRELAGIAGHGLRVRTGLTSGGLAGQVLAQAVPFALGAGLGLRLSLSWLLQPWPSSQESGGEHAWQVALIAVWALAVLAAVAGRWGAARWIGTAGVALGLVEAVDGLLSGSLFALVGWASGPLLWLALLLMAPPDLLSGRPRRTLPMAVAGAMLSWLLLLGPDYLHTPLVWDPSWRPLQLLLAALLLLVANRRRLWPAGMVVGALPLLLTFTLPSVISYWEGPIGMLAAGGFAVVLPLLALRLVRAVRAKDEPPAAV
ncbi:hypothetical protein AB0A71_24545 [Kitasatospora aureofaciens]|uniref:hypothetical protein n=1 Tax=Kitasatospora aureofaciens TaxID=1894 RepID=UPI0033E19C49